MLHLRTAYEASNELSSYCSAHLDCRGCGATMSTPLSAIDQPNVYHTNAPGETCFFHVPNVRKGESGRRSMHCMAAQCSADQDEIPRPRRHAKKEAQTHQSWLRPNLEYDRQTCAAIRCWDLQIQQCRTRDSCSTLSN